MMSAKPRSSSCPRRALACAGTPLIREVFKPDAKRKRIVSPPKDQRDDPPEVDSDVSSFLGSTDEVVQHRLADAFSNEGDLTGANR